MKKIIKTGMISILIMVIASGVWLIGYHTRKSQDNLPALETIAKMNEADVNELLVGYRNYQLDDVWGKPDTESENTWIWEIDELEEVYEKEFGGKKVNISHHGNDHAAIFHGTIQKP